MVNIDVSCIAATWNDAATPISPEDFATDRRRRVLRGALTLQSLCIYVRSMPHLRVGPRELVGVTRVGMAFRKLVGVTRVGQAFRELVGIPSVIVWRASCDTVQMRDRDCLRV